MKREKQTHEKPKYGVFQNSAYIIRTAWAREKRVPLGILAQILLTVGLSVLTLYLPKTVVGQIIAGESLRALILTVTTFTLAITLLEAIQRFIQNTAQIGRVALRMRVGIDILNKTLQTDYANLEEKAFTDAKQKANAQAESNSSSAEEVYLCFQRLGVNLLGFALYIALLARVNPTVLLITALTTLPGYYVRKRANRWRHDHDGEEADIGKRLRYLVNIGGQKEMAKDIRLFSMAGWLSDVYQAYLKLYYDFQRKAEARQFAADGIAAVATCLREGIAYAYLITMVLRGGVSVDDFVLLFAAIGGFSGWITGILTEFSALSMHSLNYCRIREFLEYPDRFQYEGGEAIHPVPGAQYRLELKDVSFQYPGADEPALKHIDLTIEPGEKLAVVGLNGAGKTTLVKLICGFYDPTEGEILLNGKNIKRYNRRDYYALYTAVFQDFNILPVTIAENVAGSDDTAQDKEKMARCFALAGIAEKIDSLPQKEQSLMRRDIHDEAVELSGGETQRLMLARALYKDSPLLILDEPTAALDPIAESRLYERYSELSRGKTSIYISHRLASTRFCDRILLVGEKRIMEIGTHEALLRSGGRYAELYEIQSKYYKEAM